MKNRDNILWIKERIEDGRCPIVNPFKKVFGKLVLDVKDGPTGFLIIIYRRSNISGRFDHYLGTLGYSNEKVTIIHRGQS